MPGILITGADGFLGKHLIYRLQSDNIHTISCIGLKSRPTYISNAVSYHQADAADSVAMEQILSTAKPDIIYHLAGLFRGSEQQVYHANLDSALSLLAAIKERTPASLLVMIGSAAEYGRVEPQDNPVLESTPCRPISIYGRSKHEATQAALESHSVWGARVIVIRPFNILGNGISTDLLVGALIDRIISCVSSPACTSIKVGRSDTIRDFISVEDVVNSLLDVSTCSKCGEIFNICSGIPTPISEVIDKLLSFSPKPLSWLHDPSLYRSNDVQVIYGSNIKANLAWGFSVRGSLEDSLRSALLYKLNMTT